VLTNPPWQKLCEHTGLSEHEAKVYVSLVKRGNAEVRNLSVSCGVPQEKVYGILKKLVDMGLVVEIPEKPQQFAPTHPANAFEKYFQSYEKKARDLYLFVSLLEGAYEKARLMSEPQRGEIWIIRGRSEILRRAGEILSQAEKRVNITTTQNGLTPLYKTFNKLVDKITKGGVAVRITAPVGSCHPDVAHELRYSCQVENVNLSSPIFFVCADERELLLASRVPDDIHAFSDKDMGVFSQNPILCILISKLLHSPEKEAIPLVKTLETAKASPVQTFSNGR